MLLSWAMMQSLSSLLLPVWYHSVQWSSSWPMMWQPVIMLLSYGDGVGLVVVVIKVKEEYLKKKLTPKILLIINDSSWPWCGNLLLVSFLLLCNRGGCLCWRIIQLVVSDGWDWRCVRVCTNMTNMTKIFTNQILFHYITSSYTYIH